MVDKLFDLVKKNWLKPKSIPAAFLLLCTGYVILVSNITEWDGIHLNMKAYLLLGLVFVGIALAYVFACLICNHLPRASKNAQAVLFVIDAESPQLFDVARFKLVDNFNTYIENGHEINFKALCIEKNQAKNYNLASKDDALRLLDKTNCLFLVSVRYSADDVNNAETFELGINNCGVRHPHIDMAARAILSNDIATLRAPIGKQNFSKSQSISVFNFTTQTLVFACQYVLGFVYLLSGNTAGAHTLLSSLRSDLLAEHSNTPGLKHLKDLVDDRLFAAKGQIAINCMQDFKKDKNLQHLHAAYTALTSANHIYSDTYFYNLNMAYVHIMLYRDLPASKACIEKCKKAASPRNAQHAQQLFFKIGSILQSLPPYKNLPLRNTLDRPLLFDCLNNNYHRWKTGDYEYDVDCSNEFGFVEKNKDGYYRMYVQSFHLDSLDVSLCAEDHTLFSELNEAVEEIFGLFIEVLKDLIRTKLAYTEFLDKYIHRESKFLQDNEIAECFIDYTKNVAYKHDHKRVVSPSSMKMSHEVYRRPDGKEKLCEVYTFDGLGAFLYFDFFRGLNQSYIPKRCDNCGKYFLLEAGKYSNYCERPLENDPQKTCRDVGARKKYGDKCKTDPVWLAYNRAYKAHYARYMKKKMTVAEFEQWSRYAIELREQTERGALLQAEYEHLLKI